MTKKEYKEQEDIIKNKKYFQAFRYAVNHDDCDFETLQNIIIESKDCETCAKFITHIKRPELQFERMLKIIFQQARLNPKQASWLTYLVIEINKQLTPEQRAEITDIVIASRNAADCQTLSYFEGFDKEKLLTAAETFKAETPRI